MFKDFLERKWVGYTAENTVPLEKVKVTFKITGKFDLENDLQMNVNEYTEKWKEFKLESPIPIKKNEFFALGTKDCSNANFSYHFPTDSFERNSLHCFIDPTPVLDQSLELNYDRGQLCFYYTLKLRYCDWSEKTHLNYPLSFQRIVPLLFFILKKKFKVPRVLIYQIFRFF